MSKKTDATTTTLEPIEAAPWETMLKKDMLDHLSRAHEWRTSDTKVTKDRLTKVHDDLHAQMIKAKAGEPKPKTRYGYEHDWHVPAIDHVHVAPVGGTASQKDVDLAAKAAGKGIVRLTEKVLPAAQRRVLKDLIDADFNSLKSEMQQFAADDLASRKNIIMKDWEARVGKGSGYVTRARTIHDKMMADLDALKEKARQDGVHLKGIRDAGRYFSPEAEIVGRAEALKQAEAENRSMLERALLRLERQRITAQRKVLVSGVTPEAAEVLDEIPAAKDLMMQAAAEEADQAAQRKALEVSTESLHDWEDDD